MALTVLGFDPGPIDGRWGPRTERALSRWGAPSGLTYTAGADGSTVEVRPVELANALVAHANAYERGTITRTGGGYMPSSTSDGYDRLDTSGSSSSAIAPDGEVVLALPFWRMSNPWAWVAGGAPILGGLALAGWFFMRPKRRRSR